MDLRVLKISLATATLVLFSVPFTAWSQETSPDRENQLHDLIGEKTVAIKGLEEEIARYQGQLTQLGGEKKSLQNQIKSFDITRKKLSADLGVTENKISRTNYKLESLSLEIQDKGKRMEINRTAVVEGLRLMNDYDNRSFLEHLLSSGGFLQAWQDAGMIQNLQNSLRSRIAFLGTVKDDLESKHVESTKIKNELTALHQELANKKKVIEYNTREKNKLLATTKNSETSYHKLLDEKVALRDAFERELLSFESELRLITDPSSIPEAQYGILNWPLDEVVITQPFGDTSFSRSNPNVYNGHGHNGVDFRASIGTPIKSALGGVVVGTGDTDIVCPAASYGKWVLIKHANGLSTLYAHVSVISTTVGSEVLSGAIIGYSGNTGYATGPHLHFTVYATQGVEIIDRKSRVCGGTYQMPVADLRAYLNPLLYLPKLP